MGLLGVDGGAPGCGVFGIRHLLEGEIVEIGVAEVVRTIHVGSAEGFGDDVDLGGAAVGTQFREIVAGEDVEDFDEDDAAGGWRGRGDDVVAAIVAADGVALFYLVGGEVFGGDEASAGLFCIGDLMGHSSVVELVGVFGDAGESGGEFGLLEGVAFFVEIAVALEDVCGCGEAGNAAAGLEHASFGVGEDEAFGGEADGRGHILREG